MPGERLTRAELGWLLAQEARGAASALRAEVNELRASLRPPGLEPQADDKGRDSSHVVINWVNEPRATSGATSDELLAPGSTKSLVDEPPESAAEERASAVPGERHLNVIDEAIDMLATLQQPAAPKSKRRGRIDLAALLYDLAPNCRLSIEPGAGTEVIGDEHELRRMFHLLLNQQTGGSGEGATLNTIEIRRQAQWIHISVELGPDTAAANDLERRWLSRMAAKHGGRLELHGRRQRVILPAETSSHEEVDQLKRELEQAQLLGEVYARELATALSHDSSIPPQSAGTALNPSLTAAPAPNVLVASLAAALVPTLKAVSREGHAGGALSASTLEAVDALKAQFQYVLEADEPARRLELRELVQQAAQTAGHRGSKRGVHLQVDLSAAGGEGIGAADEPLLVATSPRPFAALLALLIEQALHATPSGGTVYVTLVPRDKSVLVRVADPGPAIPQSLADGVMAGSVDPASVGRPAGPALLIAAHLAARLGATLSLGADAQHATAEVGLPR